MDNEKKTLKIMIELYCKKHHNSKKNTLCDSCLELFNYAIQQLKKCPIKEEKPVCQKCPIHCYRPEKREQIRKIMRYSGPKMIFYHPIIAIKHLINKTKN